MPRVFNFSAGPAIIPEEVLRRAASEMTDYNGTGMSVMEMSHRSKEYIAVYEGVERKLRAAMSVPANYKILFLQGGATMQFSAVPMNLLSRKGKADYAVTGFFAKKAFKCAQMYGNIRAAVDTGNYYAIPAREEISVDPDASYFHFCHNNTVYGTRWPTLPETGDVPLVCDMSSSILSEPIDVSKFGVIYAGAQKNMGPAGLTVVIVRDDLLDVAPLPGTPDLMTYKSQAENDSMINTPATYGIYLLGLVLDWLEEQGGTAAMAAHNGQKAKLIYGAVEQSPVFTCKVEPRSRSVMNAVFSSDSDETDAKFIKEAAGRGMVTLKAHRATGGIRASMYNAMPLEGAKTLAKLIEEFKA
ncbi:MAG: 3-phosphoserine/phosphohydroxythreonine transaminase [Oscillospiraceae bacterium]|nr:3-phosphoserine/phosphohydroxythreonine transaminase [Oscillospiraceae bacterium]